jgi:hypothetical protein
MPELTESQLIERLCKTFNTRFSGNRNAMQSMSDTIEFSDMLHPGLRGLNGKAFLSSFSSRMGIWHPDEMRTLVMDILVALMKEKITSDSSKKDLVAEIDCHLLPIKFW